MDQSSPISRTDEKSDRSSRPTFGRRSREDLAIDNPERLATSLIVRESAGVFVACAKLYGCTPLQGATMLSTSRGTFRFILHALVVGAILYQAQAQSPRIYQGRVLDSTRAPIAGAQVKVAPEGLGADLSTVSDQNGEFSLPLESGKYSLE